MGKRLPLIYGFSLSLIRIRDLLLSDATLSESAKDRKLGGALLPEAIGAIARGGASHNECLASLRDRTGSHCLCPGSRTLSLGTESVSTLRADSSVVYL